MQRVEEVKCIIRILPIWFAGTIYFVSMVQQQNYPVFQAIQSDRRIGSGSFKIPAASYSVFQMLCLTLWIPVYDRLIVPFIGKITKKEAGITILQKIGIGIVLSIFTMLISGLVENKRRSLALTKPLGSVERKGAISSLSGYWLVPQLALVGLSEAFTVIGLIEFYYKQFPENMRSFAGSFLFCSSAISSYLSSFLITVVHRVTRNSAGENWLAEDLNKGKLDYFYYFIAGLMVLNLGYFLVVAKWYKYKGTADNMISEVAMDKIKPNKTHVHV